MAALTGGGLKVSASANFSIPISVDRSLGHPLVQIGCAIVPPNGAAFSQLMLGRIDARTGPLHIAGIVLRCTDSAARGHQYINQRLALVFR